MVTVNLSETEWKTLKRKNEIKIDAIGYEGYHGEGRTREETG
jgi:hypothetical protein